MPRYIDADVTKTGLKQEFCTACSGDYENNRQCCAACDIAYIMNLIDETPTADVEPIRHGRWIMREKDKLIATGKIAVSEGHILHKSSFDEPFTLQSANIIKIKEHRTVKIPYCSICGNYGDDENDKTPYCPYCGAKMDKEEK